jgi:hypothetical protein
MRCAVPGPGVEPPGYSDAKGPEGPYPARQRPAAERISPRPRAWPAVAGRLQPPAASRRAPLTLARGDAAALAALALLVAVQLWPAAGPGRLPENLDLMLQYVPNAGYLASSLAEGRVPLWNPYLGAGMPFAADPGAGAWYLPAWPLLLALPLHAAVRAVIWLHLLWAAAGAYAFGRVALRCAPPAAFLGALTFALAAWLPALAGMPVVLTSLAWLPWIVVLGVQAAERGGRWPGWLALATAAQAVSGWPAGVYLSWLALGLYWLFGSAWRGPAAGSAPHSPTSTPGGSGGTRVTGARALAGRGPARELALQLARLAASGLLATLLAAVLLIPAAELVRETSYAGTRSLDQVARDGYLTLLAWFRPAGGHGTVESSQFYLGMAPLTLALAGALFGRRREAGALGLLAVFALVAAAGTHGPLFALLYHWLPGFRIVYLPARLGFVAAFALAGLAALGMQRVLDAPLTRRQWLAVAAALAGLGPLVLLQFWHSEGYDDFRRLLTNVGRFAGGPFLTRAQEAQYLVAGIAALAALAAVSRRRHQAAALLLGVAMVDVVATHQLARPAGLDPRAWYAPALQSAAAIAPALGHERLAGLQWHGAQHFLARFPASADPRLLPPNLALLARVRDAQGYNPLLLRRAAEYFGQANAASPGQAPPDEHWLWLTSFPGPWLDGLAVRLVLAGDAAWRVRSVPVVPALALRHDSTPVRLALDPLPAGGRPVRVHVVSFLGEGAAVPDGAEVAGVRLLGAAGESATFILRAGVDTAEWAYGRPDVRAVVQHRQAPIALETQLVNAVTGRFAVYEYRASFDLVPDLQPIAVELTPRLPAGTSTTLHLSGAWLELPAAYIPAEIAAPAPGALRNIQAQPRLRLPGGQVEIVEDLPERVAARLRASAPGQVVLADTFYPGWVARLDGRPAPVEPSDGLFRAVSVPAGEHTLVFRYEAGSLRLGFAVTAAGLALTGWLLLRPAARRLPESAAPTPAKPVLGRAP